MKTFKEIRENWDKDEEKAFANVLFYLAKKGTRGAIKTGKALLKGAKRTGDYIERKVIALMIPIAGIKELQALENMGIDIPGFSKQMTPNQRRAWDKAYEGTINEALSRGDLVKIKAALKTGKTIIGKAKPGYAKDKEFKILKVFQFPIGIIQQKMTKVDWGEGPKDMDPKHITSYTISENEVSEKN